MCTSISANRISDIWFFVSVLRTSTQVETSNLEAFSKVAISNFTVGESQIETFNRDFSRSFVSLLSKETLPNRFLNRLFSKVKRFTIGKHLHHQTASRHSFLSKSCFSLKAPLYWRSPIAPPLYHNKLCLAALRLNAKSSYTRFD